MTLDFFGQQRSPAAYSRLIQLLGIPGSLLHFAHKFYGAASWVSLRSDIDDLRHPDFGPRYHVGCNFICMPMPTPTDYIVSKPLALQGIIQTIRKEADLSQNEVATRLSISSGSYSEYERNLLQGSLSRFLKLLNALDGELVIRVNRPPGALNTDIGTSSKP